jgi:hypothetical protein
MPDSTVRCLQCGRRLRVSFADCLAHGWPKCHSATMRLISKPSFKLIDASVHDIIAPAVSVAVRATRHEH